MKSSNCHPCKRSSSSSQEATRGEEDLAVEVAGDSLVVAVGAASVVAEEAEVVVAAGEAAAIDLTGGIRSCCNLNGRFSDVVLRKRGREYSQFWLQLYRVLFIC
jgi:hypothetical protein